MLTPSQTARVTGVQYVQAEGPTGAYDALRIDLSNGCVAYVPNGAYREDNVALRVLAYCDAAPSRLDDAEGSVLPFVHTTREGEVRVADTVANIGRSMLRRADWFEMETIEVQSQ